MSFSSDFSKQLATDASIVSLMADLGDALNVNPAIRFLGGGNPARIPAFESLMSELLSEIAKDPEELHKLIGVYQSPQGSERLISNLASYLQGQGWPVSERNICITSGSQTAFFMLINLLAGAEAGKEHRKIYLPLVPEYLGYADQGLASDMFVTAKPNIELTAPNRFKYRIDFDALSLDESVAALCVSRPTNPSGNMISDSELERLGKLADAKGIPLIVDCAYGQPFPGLVYGAGSSRWQANRVFVLSLSKLGMPGVRTGIVIADESIIDRLVNSNTVISLANGNLGPMLMSKLIETQRLDQLCKQVVIPFYEAKRKFTLETIDALFVNINYRVHESDGAFFLWLWFPELAISSAELYQRLKEKDVLVMDGEHFFFDHVEHWDHAQQCIRLSYCADDDVIYQALQIIANELATLTV